MSQIIYSSPPTKLAMDALEMAVTATIQKIATDISELVRNIPGLDFVFLLIAEN